MATKSDRRTATIPVASVCNIGDLDHLPLIRRRRAALAPLKFFLLTAATVLVILLTGIVVYLVISLSLVQRQLTIVRTELTSASNRLDMFQKELGTHKENHTSEKSNRSETAHSRLKMLQLLSHRHNSDKEHRVEKREGESRSRHSSAVKRTKREKRDRVLHLVEKEINNLRKEMKSLRNDVAHPSALMVLPDDQQTLNDVLTTNNADNAIQWVVDQNSLFDTRNSTHLVVQTHGTYFIYLQITYNGQRKKANPSCSHIVMLDNPTYAGRNRPLLYGSSTQYKLGEAIRFQLNGGVLRAIDTVHVSGVFHLTVGDLLYVKPDDFSHDCIVSPLKDKTFFGAFRLQSSFLEYS